MTNRSIYLTGIILVLITSLFFVRKVKKNYVPPIKFSSLVLKDLDGKNIEIKSFEGKPLIVNFWGTWCGPCREELPDFEKVKKHYGGKVNFVMISDESIGKIAKFKEENKYTFVYAQSQLAFQEMGITSVPFTYFYDANGKPFAKIKGSVSEAELIEFVGKMIKD